MVNFDGVWELRTYYTSAATGFPSFQHVLKLDVNISNNPDVGEDFDQFTVQRRNETLASLNDWYEEEFLPVIRPVFDSTSDFVRAELWRIPEGTFNATFYSVKEIGLIGTGGTPNQMASQTTFTFRSQGGGNGRVQLMESIFGGNGKQSPPYASTQANNLTNFVIAPTSPILARDNTPFIARIHQSDGQNETLWRKRFRP